MASQRATVWAPTSAAHSRMWSRRATAERRAVRSSFPRRPLRRGGHRRLGGLAAGASRGRRGHPRHDGRDERRPRAARRTPAVITTRGFRDVLELGRLRGPTVRPVLGQAPAARARRFGSNSTSGSSPTARRSSHRRRRGARASPRAWRPTASRPSPSAWSTPTSARLEERRSRTCARLPGVYVRSDRVPREQREFERTHRDR